MTESPRRKARELVLKALYACEVEENDPREIFQALADETGLSAKNEKFASDFFELIRSNVAWANRIITHIVKNWDIERLTLIDRLILRMALVELREVPDTPEKVAINEAIELAKKFSTGESPAFVNGILDQYLKNIAEFEKF